MSIYRLIIILLIWLFMPIPRNGKIYDLSMPFCYFGGQFSPTVPQIDIEALAVRYDALVLD